MELLVKLNKLLEFGMKFPSEMTIDCQKFNTLFTEARKWARESNNLMVPVNEVSLDNVVQIIAG